jgi:hypothetical protein
MLMSSIMAAASKGGGERAGGCTSSTLRVGHRKRAGSGKRAAAVAGGDIGNVVGEGEGGEGGERAEEGMGGEGAG